MKNFKIHLVMIFLFNFIIVFNFAQSQMIANITEDVETEFGTYHPYSVSFSPNVPTFSVEADFGNVTNFEGMNCVFNSVDSAFLFQNHFAVKRSRYKQLFDVYNDCTWDGIPIFVTTDAVLHIYHVLFDHFLSEIEMQRFVASLKLMTDVLIDGTESAMNEANLALTQEALKRNLAFLYVAKKNVGSIF